LAGLYVHVPFRARRCVYCDFYFGNVTRRALEREDETPLSHKAWRLGEDQWVYPAPGGRSAKRKPSFRENVNRSERGPSEIRANRATS
jgi:hypothetical protein